jgi:hypothetical protein
MTALTGSFGELKSDLKKAANMLAFSAALPGFLRERVTVELAKSEIKKALDKREARFLELIRTQVYNRSGSPYLKLLANAGCAFTDLETHVNRHGVEKTLERLASEGVYFTSDEYKGKKQVVRGGLCFKVCPHDFELPESSPGFVKESSGTRNAPLRSNSPLEWLALRTWATGIFFAAHNLFSYAHAVYDGIPPGTALNHLLVNAKLGKSTERWFARSIPARNSVEQAYFLLVTYLAVLMGKTSGPGLPKPEFLDIKDIHRIIRWISEKQQDEQPCYIICVASSAARIARVAWEMGVSLEGTVFGVAGDPLTEQKEILIKKVKAATISRYSYGGGVSTGYGCAQRIFRDEVHVNQHLLAVISHPTRLASYTPAIHPILLTTLHPAAPRFLLNVENGDYVRLEERDCGCALQQAGLTLHLHHIQSYEKFTSEGMNYFYAGIYELLEHVFPSDFGGGPGDYQLVEEEDANAQTRLTLVVHPEVGPLDESRVLSRLRIAFSNGSRNNRFMSGVWEHAGTFRVRRGIPYASSRGKILPLRIVQNSKHARE